MSRLVSALLVAVLLSACGQSGALYLPEREAKKPKPQAPAEDAPAAPAEPAPVSAPAAEPATPTP